MYIIMEQLSSKNISTYFKNYDPISLKLHIVFQNNCEIPFNMHSTIRGTIYKLFREIDPVFSYRIHSSRNIKPFSFSNLQFKYKLSKSKKKGFIKIPSKTSANLTIKGIDPIISKCIYQFSIQNKILHIGQGIAKIIRVNYSIPKAIPDSYKTIQIKLHSTTFIKQNLQKLSKQHRISLTMENIIDSIVDSIYRIYQISINPIDVYPYIIPISKYTSLHNSKGYIMNKSKQLLTYHGEKGILTYEIIGNHQLIGKMFQLIEYIGIGSKTSYGFGHCSIFFK